MPRYKPPAEYLSATIDWPDLLRQVKLPKKAPGCDWITFDSIQDCLNRNHMEDTDVPQNKTSHHAARIADLVTRLWREVRLNPIHLHLDHCVAIYDGSHRLRAYQFTERLDSIPVILTGEHARTVAWLCGKDKK